MVIDDIRKRGFLRAGVSLGFYGFSRQDISTGQWRGFDIDLARAISAAIFGDNRDIEFTPLQSAERFEALHTSRIDIGTYNASITLGRELVARAWFTHPMLYDGEALLVRNSAIQADPDDINTVLAGCPRIAALRGSTTSDNLARFFQSRTLPFTTVLYDSPAQARQAYDAADCDMYCLDRYLLAGERIALSHPAEHTILSYAISREAMAPFVAFGDTHWHATATWIMRCLIEAESLALGSHDIAGFDSRHDTYEYRFLNPPAAVCDSLHLKPGFVKTMIRAVGHYGTIFESNLGSQSEIKAPRRENRPWSHGGLLWSPNFI